MIEEMNKEMIEREQHNQKRIMELKKEIKELKLDIEDLQQEKLEYNDKHTKLIQMYHEEKQKIYKALDYINHRTFIDFKGNNDLIRLYDILGGKDE